MIKKSIFLLFCSLMSFLITANADSQLADSADHLSCTILSIPEEANIKDLIIQSLNGNLTQLANTHRPPW